MPAGLGTTYPLVGPVPPMTPLTLAIGLPLQNQAGLAAFVQQVSDPTSPTYRQYLTPAGFAAAYGPPLADHTSLQAWATGHGLTVTGTSAGREILSVTGTANAFFVSLDEYLRPDGTTFLVGCYTTATTKECYYPPTYNVSNASGGCTLAGGDWSTTE